MAEREQGYDCELVDSPPKELQSECPICLLILRDPYQVSCCGTNFCRPCIQRIQAGKNPCPLCKQPFTTFADKRLKRSLSGIRVLCEHQQDGCRWVGELAELARHLNATPAELGKPQLEGCKFAKIKCSHCGKPFQRRHVETHQNDSCPRRPYTCDYCQDFGAEYVDIVNKHWPVCPCYPVKCPNGCRASIQRKNYKHHTTKKCPLTVVECYFRHAGCKVQLPRKDIQKHLEERMHTHMSLLAVHSQGLENRVVELEKAKALFTKHINHLRKHNTELKEEVAQLQRHKNALRLELDQLRKHDSELKSELDGVRKHRSELKRELELVRANNYVPPLTFVMEDFEHYQRENDTWFSAPFYSHPCGYKMCLSVKPGHHLAVFIHLMSGQYDSYLAWPFRGDITIQLLNQLEDSEHHTKTIKFTNSTPTSSAGRVLTERGKPWGLQIFVTLSDLDHKASGNCQYLKYNCLRFRVSTIRYTV